MAEPQDGTAIALLLGVGFIMLEAVKVLIGFLGTLLKRGDTFSQDKTTLQDKLYALREERDRYKQATLYYRKKNKQLLAELQKYRRALRYLYKKVQDLENINTERDE